MGVTLLSNPQVMGKLLPIIKKAKKKNINIAFSPDLSPQPSIDLPSRHSFLP